MIKEFLLHPPFRENDRFCEIPHQLERETSVSEDAGLQRGVNHEIPRRLERGTSASEDARPRREMDCEIPHRLERGTKHYL